MSKKSMNRLERLREALNGTRHYKQPEIAYTYKKEAVLLSTFTTNKRTVFYLFTLTGEDYYQKHQITLEERESALYITELILLNKEQYNKGYGSLLIQKAVDFAKEEGLTRVIRNFSSEEATAYNRNVSLFKKNAFHVFGSEAVKELSEGAEPSQTSPEVEVAAD
ncbi:GNAT family N-acetyltransferase [Alteribacter aurantiacus]|uniref:GNAT family N-acetyltransferase n=1 Tax=Alteribacter aurantiacus TaxID=254410 RepID=UPI0003F554B6|nr:GNAT family N-acetyltransferase [Alteribacter aurantiacus]